MNNPSSNLQIRMAGPTDLPSLLMLYSDLIGEDEPASHDLAEGTYRQILDNPGLCIFLGTRAGQAVTTCLLITVPNLTRGCRPFAIIENVVTLEAFRGKGFGETIVRAAVDAAFKRRCYKIMLMSGVKNKAAHRFYKRIGFSQGKVGFELRAPGYPPRTIS